MEKADGVFESKLSGVMVKDDVAMIRDGSDQIKYKPCCDLNRTGVK